MADKRYKDKHKNVQEDRDVQAALQKHADNGKISCAMVHRVAKNLDVPPEEAGKQADLIDLKFHQCQVGLFGWEPDWKILDKDISLTDDLSAAIDQAAENGRITCRQCWDTAKDLKVKRSDVGSACEKKGVKIIQCQIGAF